MEGNLRRRARWLAARPYSQTLELDETTDGQPVYVATTPELPGCLAQGQTPEEALRSMIDARIDYIESLLEDGLRVPEPAVSASTSSGSSLTIMQNGGTPPSEDAPIMLGRRRQLCTIVPVNVSR